MGATDAKQSAISAGQRPGRGDVIVVSIDLTQQTIVRRGDDRLIAYRSRTLIGVTTTKPEPDPRFLRRIDCPECHKTIAVKTRVWFGRTSYYCPNCEHTWDVPRRDTD